MQKKLRPIGNSLGLIIEKPILSLLNIDRDTLLEVRTDGRTLIICPVVDKGGARVKGSCERMMDCHDPALRGLAE